MNCYFLLNMQSTRQASSNKVVGRQMKSDVSRGWLEPSRRVNYNLKTLFLNTMDDVCRAVSQTMKHKAMQQRDRIIQDTKLKYANHIDQLIKHQTAILASIEQQYAHHMESVDTTLLKHFKLKASNTCTLQELLQRMHSQDLGLAQTETHSEPNVGESVSELEQTVPEVTRDNAQEHPVPDPSWSETVLNDEASVALSRKDLQDLLVARCADGGKFKSLSYDEAKAMPLHELKQALHDRGINNVGKPPTLLGRVVYYDRGGGQLKKMFGSMLNKAERIKLLKQRFAVRLPRSMHTYSLKHLQLECRLRGLDPAPPPTASGPRSKQELIGIIRKEITVAAWTGKGAATSGTGKTRKIYRGKNSPLTTTLCAQCFEKGETRSMAKCPKCFANFHPPCFGEHQQEECRLCLDKSKRTTLRRSSRKRKTLAPAKKRRKLDEPQNAQAVAHLNGPRHRKLDETQPDRSANSGHIARNTAHPGKCTHCGAQETPQWRRGPSGPNTLCNRCGIKWRVDGL